MQCRCEYTLNLVYIEVNSLEQHYRIPRSNTSSTLYNVCSAHRGMFSTSGYHEYIGGCSVHRGEYHEYIGGCSVHRGDTMSTSGDTMSTSGGYHEYIGGYHEYIGGCSVHRWMFSTLGFSIEIERFLPTCSPTRIMIVHS